MRRRLILLKLLAYWRQDQLDIENLVAAHRVTADLAWSLVEWATVAAADYLWMGRLMALFGRRAE